MQLFIKNYNEINFKNCYVEFNSVTFWVTNKAQSTCAVLLLVRHELKKKLMQDRHNSSVPTTRTSRQIISLSKAAMEETLLS